MAAAEDQPALVEVMWEEEQELNKIIEEEQTDRAQISVLSQMQLQAMERVEEQEQELWWPNAIMKQTQREIHNPPSKAEVKAASERKLPSAPDMTPQASLLLQSPA